MRELAYLISKSGATKGILVTTSRLTKGAIKLIQENKFTMSFIDNETLEKQLVDVDNKADIIMDLPF